MDKDRIIFHMDSARVVLKLADIVEFMEDWINTGKTVVRYMREHDDEIKELFGVLETCADIESALTANGPAISLSGPGGQS